MDASTLAPAAVVAVGGALAAIAFVTRLSATVRGSFADSFVGFRDDGWPRGLQEDDDAHWSSPRTAIGRNRRPPHRRPSGTPVPPTRPQRDWPWCLGAEKGRWLTRRPVERCATERGATERNRHRYVTFARPLASSTRAVLSWPAGAEPLESWSSIPIPEQLLEAFPARCSPVRDRICLIVARDGGWSAPEAVVARTCWIVVRAAVSTGHPRSSGSRINAWSTVGLIGARTGPSAAAESFSGF